MPKATTVSRAGIRSNPRKPESHTANSNTRSFQRQEPPTRAPQQPSRSLRPLSTLPHASNGPGTRNAPPTPSLENHETCFAIVETLERENKALKTEKESLSECIREFEGKEQSWLNEQHRLKHQLSKRREIHQFVQEVQNTVAAWQQRLRASADPPDEEEPAVMSTVLPATTSVPDMWATQEGGVFNNDDDIVPSSDNFTRFFQF